MTYDMAFVFSNQGGVADLTKSKNDRGRDDDRPKHFTGLIFNFTTGFLIRFCSQKKGVKTEEKGVNETIICSGTLRYFVNYPGVGEFYISRLFTLSI